MALINCEECGKSVSTRAGACPHCGCPLPKAPNCGDHAVEMHRATPRRQTPHPKKYYLLLLAGTGAFALVVLLLFLFSHLDEANPPEGKSNNNQRSESDSTKSDSNTTLGNVSPELGKEKVPEEIAMRLLNDYFAKPELYQLAFSDTGFDLAISDGLVVARQNFGTDYFFTERGLEVFGNENRNISIWMAVFAPKKFRFTTPITARAIKMTEHPTDQFSGKYETWVTTEYILPQRWEKMAKYIAMRNETTHVEFSRINNEWRINSIRNRALDLIK